jgi:hypothetical protein
MEYLAEHKRIYFDNPNPSNRLRRSALASGRIGRNNDPSGAEELPCAG